MKILDSKDIRKYWKETHPKVDFDCSYTFYYDETNNIKKFYIKELDFNYSFTSNFILGGLVFENAPPDFTDVFSALKLQKSIKEVKLKHIAKGDFISCLKSEKLNYYLKYLIENKVSVHFTWLNLLYWSLADIVDSAVANIVEQTPVARFMVDKVKSDLYTLAKLELDGILQLFYTYQYPNIKKENIVPFIEDLTSLFDGYIDTEELHFGLESLRQVLKEAKRNESLPFLEDEEDYILLKDFSQFYLSSVYLFKNSTHVFDQEQSISEIIANTKIMEGEIEIRNYSFVDSVSNPIIQASDIFIGLIGKLSNFLNTSTYDDIVDCISLLSEIQNSNIDLIFDLIDMSLKKNLAFINTIDSQEETEKFQLIREMRDK